MSSTPSHRQRLEACLANQPLDHVPVALWRHFPVDDQSPEGLARATLDYQKFFDFDLVKVTPSSSFCLKDWGVQDEWHGVTEGTRDYTKRVIQNPEDWEKLPALDPYSGCLGAQLRCLTLIHEELKGHTPILQTIFNPLSQAKNLVGGDMLLVHMRRYPEAVHTGLQIITESTLRFIEASIRTGIAGIFFAEQHAQYGLLSTQEFLDFGKAYDLQILGGAQGLWLNMLHLHGNQVMFSEILDYPIHVINWHDRDTWPSLDEASKITPAVLCGGLRRERTMVLGTPEQVDAEAKDAIQTTRGKRFILGTGCVVPITAPAGNILAARKSVE
jgi:uroporphyrinogen decarboxylase